MTYREQEEQLIRFANRVKTGARGVICVGGDADVTIREVQEVL